MNEHAGLVVVEMSTPDEAIDLERLCAMQHEEIGGSVAFDLDAVRETIRNCAIDKQRTTQNCWIAYKAGRAIGYLGAFAHRTWWSYQRHAHAEQWYVTPDHRGTMCAVRLLRTFEGWAHRIDAEIGQVSVLHFSHDDASMKVINLVERLGYSCRGHFAIKHLRSE